MIATAFGKCAIEGVEFDEVCEVITARGNCLWVRAIGSPVRDENGHIHAVQGAFQDISDMRADEVRADEAHRQRIEVLENIYDAFFTLDHYWIFTSRNREAERVLRRPREALLGRNLWVEFPAAVGSAFQTEYELALARGETRRFR